MSHFLAESAAFIIASVRKRLRTRDKIEREKSDQFHKLQN